VVHVFDCETPISDMKNPHDSQSGFQKTEIGIQFDRIPISKKHFTAKLKGESGILHPDSRMPQGEEIASYQVNPACPEAARLRVLRCHCRRPRCRRRGHVILLTHGTRPPAPPTDHQTQKTRMLGPSGGQVLLFPSMPILSY
jgi:hypothetical protein